MKKRFLPLLLSLIFSFTFLTACSTPVTLYFNSAFFGENAPLGSYAETLTYKVEYSDEKLSEVIKNTNNLSFEFSNGKKVVDLQVLANKPTLPDNLSSDLFAHANDSTTYIFLSSSMSIDVKFTINDKVFEHKDTITQKAYFFNHTLSYAPIYSETFLNYTVFNHDETNSSCQVVNTSTSTLYNNNSYTVKTNVTNSEGKVDSIENDYDYTFKTVIDNNSLLFTLINLSLEEEGSMLLPTVSYTYGESKDLIVKYLTSGTKDMNITYNGNTVQTPISYKKITFSINSINSAGAEQTVLIQKDKTDDIPLKALLLSYEEPLVAYGTFSPMGALVYTLTDIEIK